MKFSWFNLIRYSYLSYLFGVRVESAIRWNAAIRAVTTRSLSIAYGERHYTILTRLRLLNAPKAVRYEATEQRSGAQVSVITWLPPVFIYLLKPEIWIKILLEGSRTSFSNKIENSINLLTSAFQKRVKMFL